MSAGPRVAPDLKHAAIEERFFAVGRTAAGRATYVVFTLRGELIRPLSARYMHAGEIANMKRRLPKFHSDQEAIEFLDQDLSDLDLSQFKPVTFEFTAKTARLDMRLPQQLLDSVRLRAKARGIPTTRYIRKLIERDANEASSRPRRP